MTHHSAPHRRSIRLQGYDYTQSGAYFVTVVVQDRLCLFGDVVDQEMRMNEAGEMVRRVWKGFPTDFRASSSMPLSSCRTTYTEFWSLTALSARPSWVLIAGHPTQHGRPQGLPLHWALWLARTNP